MIFAFYDLKHFLRCFPAATLKPELNDSCQSAFEKFHVVMDKVALKVFLGKLCIIRNDFIIVVIPQLKIGLIENLVLLNVAKLLGSGEINHIGPGEKSQYRPDENRQSRVASPPAVLFTRPVVGQPVSW